VGSPPSKTTVTCRWTGDRTTMKHGHGGRIISNVPSLYRALAALAILVAVAGAAMWSVSDDHAEVGVLLALVDLALSGCLFALVRCRRCGELVGYRRFRRGMGTPDYVGFPLDGRCSKCGAELWRFGSTPAGFISFWQSDMRRQVPLFSPYICLLLAVLVAGREEARVFGQVVDGGGGRRPDAMRTRDVSSARVRPHGGDSSRLRCE
jgi:hypothetical protein